MIGGEQPCNRPSEEENWRLFRSLWFWILLHEDDTSLSSGTKPTDWWCIWQATGGDAAQRPVGALSRIEPAPRRHVHRLDKETSGLMVVAKPAYAKFSREAALKSARSNASTAPLRIVSSPSDGKIETQLGRDLHNRLKMVKSSTSAANQPLPIS